MIQRVHDFIVALIKVVELLTCFGCGDAIQLDRTGHEGEGQLQPILKSGLRWAFRIMDCRDTRGYDVTLTDNQKRALVKRIADIYEKVGVAGLALGLFQYNFQGALIGLGFLAVSLLLTYLLER